MSELDRMRMTQAEEMLQTKTEEVEAMREQLAEANASNHRLAQTRILLNQQRIRAESALAEAQATIENARKQYDDSRQRRYRGFEVASEMYSILTFLSAPSPTEGGDEPGNSAMTKVVSAFENDCGEKRLTTSPQAAVDLAKEYNGRAFTRTITYGPWLPIESEPDENHSTGEHRKVGMYGDTFYVCDTCVNSLGFNIRWDQAPCRIGVKHKGPSEEGPE